MTIKSVELEYPVAHSGSTQRNELAYFVVAGGVLIRSENEFTRTEIVINLTMWRDILERAEALQEQFQ